MKAFNRAVDKFCARHPRFGIPNLMLFVVIGTAAVWLFNQMDTTGYFLYYLTFNPALILKGQVWRLITFLFIPENGSLVMLALWLYFYYFIGSNLENAWGTARFTCFYLCGVVLTIVYSLVVWAITRVPAAGAVTGHYIHMSMFLAFAAMYPDQEVLVFFIIPLKIKWLALLDAAYLLYTVLMFSFPFNLLPLVALLNCLLFCWEYLSYALRPMRYNTSSRVVNFKKEKRRIEKEEQHQAKTYKRKCEVCGRTDTDYPDLEFRFCSRCQGYHCFCQDHINSHVHFSE